MDTAVAKDDQSSDLKEIHKTWQNVEINIKTIGFGDGASFGRDTTFQYYFSQGFSEGFRGGHAVGEYKGSLFCETLQKNKEVLDKQLLNNTQATWCQICENKELLNKSIAEVVGHQAEACNRILKQLEVAFPLKS